MPTTPSPTWLGRRAPRCRRPSWWVSCPRPPSRGSPRTGGSSSGSAACRPSRPAYAAPAWCEVCRCRLELLCRGDFAAAAGQGPGPADAAALAFAHAAPDAELLAVLEGVLEALEADDAAPAHLLGLPRRRAPLREEEVGVDAETVGLVLPAAAEHVNL